MAGPGRRIGQLLTGAVLAALYIVYVGFFAFLFAWLPLVGLVTGVLHLPVRGGFTFHGPVARLISAAMLIVAAWVAYLSLRKNARGLFRRLFSQQP